MKITTDLETGCAYIYLTDNDVASTKEISDSVLIDRDEHGAIVGIELLDIDALEIVDHSELNLAPSGFVIDSDALAYMDEHEDEIVERAIRAFTDGEQR